VDLSKEKVKHPLLALEHKVVLAFFILFGLIAIPFTVFKSVQKPSTGGLHIAEEEPHDNLQLSTFDPTFYGKKTAIPHTDNEIIVRYVSSIKIITSIDQDTSSFKVSDITDGLPQEAIDNLKQTKVQSIEKVIKNTNTSRGAASTYISNIYKLTFPQGTNLADVMNSICDDGNVEMYCEPNYKFSLATQPPENTSFVPSKVSSTGSSSVGKIALIDAPLPENYNAIAQKLGMPSISEAQIMSGAEPPRTDLYVGHSLAAALELYSVDSNTKIIYAGACGDVCSSNSIANAIVLAADNGAKVIYIGIKGDFPQDIVPQSVLSAVGYAQSKGIGVIIPDSNQSLTINSSRNKDLTLVKRLIKLLSPTKAFAEPPPPLTCSGCATTTPLGNNTNSMNAMIGGFLGGQSPNPGQLTTLQDFLNGVSSNPNLTTDERNAIGSISNAVNAVQSAQQVLNNVQNSQLPATDRDREAAETALQTALNSINNAAERASRVFENNEKMQGGNLDLSKLFEQALSQQGNQTSPKPPEDPIANKSGADQKSQPSSQQTTFGGSKPGAYSVPAVPGVYPNATTVFVAPANAIHYNGNSAAANAYGGPGTPSGPAPGYGDTGGPGTYTLPIGDPGNFVQNGQYNIFDAAGNVVGLYNSLAGTPYGNASSGAPAQGGGSGIWTGGVFTPSGGSGGDGGGGHISPDFGAGGHEGPADEPL